MFYLLKLNPFTKLNIKQQIPIYVEEHIKFNYEG